MYHRIPPSWFWTSQTSWCSFVSLLGTLCALLPWPTGRPGRGSSLYAIFRSLVSGMVSLHHQLLPEPPNPDQVRVWDTVDQIDQREVLLNSPPKLLGFISAAKQLGLSSVIRIGGRSGKVILANPELCNRSNPHGVFCLKNDENLCFMRILT